MSWTIERRGRVAAVTMKTNKVNAQGRPFFAELHAAFDVVERDHAESPVVLTGHDGRFSAGLDLDEHFRLFAGDRDPVASWFAGYRATNMRLFTYPRPMVAAVNGHAFAGGLITAAVCDYRVCVQDGARVGLNEVPLGMVNELVPGGDVLDQAVAVARMTPEDCLQTYAFTKAACQASALRNIAELADRLDEELADGMTHEQSRPAHRRYWQQLKGSPARW